MRNIWIMHKKTKIVLYTFLASTLYYLTYKTLQQLKSFKQETTSNSAFVTHISMPEELIGRQLGFDQVYEPRKIGLSPDIQKPTISKKAKTILMWTNWNHLSKTINYYSLQKGRKSFIDSNCPNSNCVVTYFRRKLAKADAVLFHLLDTDIKDLPFMRDSRQTWILYNMEPTWLIKRHHPTDLYLMNNLFNWTMGYRTDSDVPAKYGFITKSDVPHPIYYDGILDRKPKDVVWLVSDCNTDSRREDYVKELQKYIDVHIYGSCGNYTCFPSQSSICYDTILKEYKFYLSFENAICKDYVTEKFFNVFNYDIVPIVFGGSNYSRIAPEGSYIAATEYPHPKLLAENLRKISDNELLYTEFLKKKSSFTAYLDPWVCRLCNKLHSKQDLAILDDVEKWFIDDAQCKIWDFELLAYRNVNRSVDIAL